MLVHENSETFAAFDVQLGRFAIGGVSQILATEPVAWRRSDWQTSYGWQAQRRRLCQEPPEHFASSASVEIELRISMQQWLSLQGPERPVLVVPMLSGLEP